MTGKLLLEDLNRSGVRLIPVDGLLEIEADEDVLTDELLASIQACKAELLTLLTVRQCDHCGAQMQHVELGYYSCTCGFQVVMPKSGYWVTGLTVDDFLNNESETQ